MLIVQQILIANRQQATGLLDVVVDLSVFGAQPAQQQKCRRVGVYAAAVDYGFGDFYPFRLGRSVCIERRRQR
ncbi:hypothetical protein [Mesorhizobium sp. WSM3859]|uniref:hypothetical protein n=1 Tax=Mesorhizobium sp. WSM3859 TaxID=2029402 RepID=UPI000BAF2D3F|nr:hypothetical protein [Mesorhizobium sp. WSM3859]PBC12169.1 hypothetical protein CK230_02165 [Mesorhizobium sp. WSM3859]